jgi:hypothetical protein
VFSNHNSAELSAITKSISKEKIISSKSSNPPTKREAPPRATEESDLLRKLKQEINETRGIPEAVREAASKYDPERFKFGEKLKILRLLAPLNGVGLDLVDSISNELMNAIEADDAISLSLQFIKAAKDVPLEEYFSEEKAIKEAWDYLKRNFASLNYLEKSEFIHNLAVWKPGKNSTSLKLQITQFILPVVVRELEDYPHRTLGLFLKLMCEAKIRDRGLRDLLQDSEKIHNVILENCDNDFLLLKNFVHLFGSQKEVELPEKLKKRLNLLIVERLEESLQVLENSPTEASGALLENVLKDILQLNLNSQDMLRTRGKIEALLEKFVNGSGRLRILSQEELKLLLLVYTNYLQEKSASIEKILNHIYNNIKKRDLNSNFVLNVCFCVAKAMRNNQKKNQMISEYLEHFLRSLLDQDLKLLSEREFSYLFYTLFKQQRKLVFINELLDKIRERLAQMFERKSFRLRPLLTVLRVYAENKAGMTYFYSHLEKNLVSELERENHTFQDIKYIKRYFSEENAGSRKFNTMLEGIIRDESLDRFDEHLDQYKQREVKYENVKQKKKEAYKAGMKYRKKHPERPGQQQSENSEEEY